MGKHDWRQVSGWGSLAKYQCTRCRTEMATVRNEVRFRRFGATQTQRDDPGCTSIPSKRPPTEEDRC